MTYRHQMNRMDNIDDEVEFQLVDLTDEEERATGPIDLYRSATNSLLLVNSAKRTVASPTASESGTRLCRLPNRTIVRVGETVELKCPPHRRTGAESSGDFLRIIKILKDPQANAVVLQGYRYVREKYLVGKDSDGKGPRLNELVQHLVVREDDDRPAIVQGLEEISVNEVVCKHPIVLTDRPFPMLSFRDASANNHKHLIGRSTLEQRRFFFKNGPLVCRWTRISIMSPNGTIYGGVHRFLSKEELLTPRHHQPSGSKPGSTTRRDIPAPSTSHRRTLSSEKVSLARPQRSEPSSTICRYTFFDMFCGVGGASRGADNAGLEVLGGLDYDELAMAAWEKNNPGAIPLCIDSFAFLQNANFKIIGRCDILNISFPCQPYSSAHTTKGPDDEINIEQLKIIKPLIEGLKPRVVILENTAGLANIKKNRPYLNKVLNDVRTAGSGYNLRYKIINMADYGLPQERKRLIVIAARKGTPLPPFPRPTHGPPGSGLKPYVSIGDALSTLDRLRERADRYSYHKLHKKISRSEQLYNPFAKFSDCILTGGVNSLHWSGEKFTPRELAILQSLPHHHHLTGSWSQAVKQIGNMFPPLMAEIVYRTCAQTLEAFDHKFITADEEIEDLDITLIEKRVDIPKTSTTPTSILDLTESQVRSPYRYLSQPVLSDATPLAYASAFTKRTFEGCGGLGIERQKKRVLDGSLGSNGARHGKPSPIETRRKPAGISRRERDF